MRIEEQCLNENGWVIQGIGVAFLIQGMNWRPG